MSYNQSERCAYCDRHTGPFSSVCPKCEARLAREDGLYDDEEEVDHGPNPGPNR